MRHVDALHRRMVPWFNSHSYARHCTDSSSSRPAACVLALACQPLKIGDLEFNSFASGALAMLKLQAFKSANIQFGKVDVARHGDMAPLCQALPERARNSTEMGIGLSQVPVQQASRVESQSIEGVCVYQLSLMTGVFFFFLFFASFLFFFFFLRCSGCDGARHGDEFLRLG